ncbi:MAG TPA: SBBP repeat-containing protein, partial [Terriglobia bacterium]|nr:SBBP repeat-containing protein [Terriglobia bacterium]
QLEYDFVVASRADPSRIALKIQSARTGRDAPLRVDARGDLVIGTQAGEVRFHKPVVYQLAAGKSCSHGSKVENRESVEGRYVLRGKQQVGFQVGAYDPTRPLVIDPVLSYSTYLGGTSGADYGQAIAVDPAGNAYVTGYTCSTDFPTLDPVQSLNASGGCEDAFVAKLDAGGDALVYSTFLGGTGNDVGLGIAVDPAGRAYVAGYTCSADFPVVNAVQATSNGDCDAFVSKLNSAGNNFVYSTYLGGSDTDVAQAIAADPAGNAYVTGYTLSEDFPTTNGAFQTVFGGGACGGVPGEPKPCADGFVAKLNPAGSALVYSTFLGGSSYDAGQGIAVDGAGNAYITGFTLSANFPTAHALQPGCNNCGLAGAAPGQGVSSDAFVTKLNPAGAALVYSTYLGGSGADTGTGIAVDPPGNAYVTGYTASKDFPTTNPLQTNQAGGYDAFVTKLKADGSAFVYSTYLGGSGNDLGFAIAVDSAGVATIAGETFSEDFPSSDAFQPNLHGGFDAFVGRLNAAGDALVYSSYLGGGSGDQALGVALDSSGSAYVAGITNSDDFPTTSVAFQAACEGGNACAEAGAKAYVAKVDDLDVPSAALSTLNVEFGGVTVGKTSPAQAVTLRNVGSQPLAIRKIFTASRRYFAESNDCGAALAPGASCTINVTFTPVMTGQITGFLVVTDNSWPKGLQLIRLVGNGT